MLRCVLRHWSGRSPVRQVRQGEASCVKAKPRGYGPKGSACGPKDCVHGPKDSVCDARVCKGRG